MKPRREEIRQKCILHLKENNCHEPSLLMRTITQEFYITGFEHGYDYKTQQPVSWEGTEEANKKLIELLEQQTQCQPVEVLRNVHQQDSWRGPEERPEDHQLVWVYHTNKDYKVINLSRVNYKSDYLLFIDGFKERWENVKCWCPADPGPMPERFKIKEETK